MKLHRSLTFWLGLPGLLFILWSWQDSLAHQAGVLRNHAFPTPRSSTIIFGDSLLHSRSTLRIQKLQFAPGLAGRVLTESPVLVRSPLPPGGPKGWKAIFPAPRNETVAVPFWVTEEVRLKHITIPHWLILLLYGAGWIGIMAWRKRRVKRLKQAASPDPNPDTEAA